MPRRFGSLSQSRRLLQTVGRQGTLQPRLSANGEGRTSVIIYNGNSPALELYDFLATGVAALIVKESKKVEP